MRDSAPAAAVAATAAGGVVVLLLVVAPQESGDGEINRQTGTVPRLKGEGEVGEQGTGVVPVVLRGAAASAAAAAVPVIAATHHEVPPIEFVKGVCPSQSQYTQGVGKRCVEEAAWVAGTDGKVPVGIKSW